MAGDAGTSDGPIAGLGGRFPHDRIGDLRARVRSAQGRERVRAPLRTLSALADVVPGGLRTGVSYTVRGSTTLALALLAGPSAHGLWCGVVGMPTFGAEAAQALGVDLSRVVLIPAPGADWMVATAALVDVLPLVLLSAPRTVADGDVGRLVARLRQRSATLLVLDDRDAWPRPEARLAVVQSSWSGLGAGHGHLTGQELVVAAYGKWGAPRLTRLILDATGAVRLAPESAARPGREFRRAAEQAS
ncbi:hypothetical protein [Skermania piniformis]|uniref:Recombinase A n=1 Tax=Skermania pinensis TaxID=39122 RepID=A0ABX8SFK5_9ACTN|nr:hypothetical protein [Skermania piniformis]QXQ14476.1 hypothetical protein KV203_03435 [Skermania piniformis]